ncbi:hypothetical protein KJS94_14630 [Flavihumibacter rivuli]|uniref:proton-conducting transporter transmembrane domain-containing protein n=1 Tax=Flavihumibacter rivuli TaxID=2838156 RepID=UPI001BDE14F2|nr:proton-conducting transporter membrane subunit [Flavihumibacter rivuli]ULQ55883.1 hypothetical protein KJS94_14630 [Flavihumibacter rivuli]
MNVLDWLVANEWIAVDRLTLVMWGLVGFVAINIAAFSWRYLQGDSHRKTFFFKLIMMVLALFVLVMADHFLLFLSAWALANFLLSRLMIHNPGWPAARASGNLALRSLGIGTAFLAIAFLVFYNLTGEYTLHGIVENEQGQPAASIGLAFVLMAAMSQSAIWPFHRWLLSSLNSPTPVSAIMHAGLVNGGGFLLARFAPLFLQQPSWLMIIFMLGLLTAILGTLWKLMQSDIKRMLAASTMGQMGFMFLQCGLGLFPAAVAHLCWHGLFKAYLFLASGDAAKEKRLNLGYPPPLKLLLPALLSGALGAWCFAMVGYGHLSFSDSTLVLVAVAFMAGTQLSMPLLMNPTIGKILLVALITAALGALYGLSVLAVEWALEPLGMMQAQPLQPLHLVAIIIFLSCWMALLYGQRLLNRKALPAFILKLYVQQLNASQPHPQTVTAHRNQYSYK